MKSIIILILFPLFLFSQEWDNNNWERYDFYKNGKILGSGSMEVIDIKCFGNDECYALTMFMIYDFEVFKFDKVLKIWESVYDGRWDPFNTPESEWPDITEQPRGGNLVNDSTFFAFYKDETMFNIINFKTEEYDTTHYYPKIRALSAELNSNGYGIASSGNNVFTTKNYWKDYNFVELEYPSEAWDAPVFILNNYTFVILDYNEGNSYFIISDDGVNWNRFKIGDFYARNIHFINNEIGFITGGRLLNNNHEDDVIFKTTNGGKYWYKVLDQFNQPASWGLNDIVFFDEEYGVSTAKSGEIYTTSNSGESWEYSLVDNIENNIFYASTAKGDSKFYLLTSHQGIYSYDVGLLGISSVPFHQYKEITCFPNPFVNKLTITGNSLVPDHYLIKVFSTEGKLIYSEESFLQNGTSLNLNLNSGSYYLLLEGKNYYYKKIIKE